MTKPPINIDALLVDEFGEVDEDSIETVEVEAFGETWHVRKDINTFQLVQLADPDNTAVMAKMMVNAVIPEERVDFKSALASAAGLTGDRLALIFRTLLEAASGDHPSDSSPVSKRTTPRKGARQLSKGV